MRGLSGASDNAPRPSCEVSSVGPTPGICAASPLRRALSFLSRPGTNNRYFRTSLCGRSEDIQTRFHRLEVWVWQERTSSTGVLGLQLSPTLRIAGEVGQDSLKAAIADFPSMCCKTKKSCPVIYGVFSASCIFRRIQHEITTDCVCACLASTSNCTQTRTKKPHAESRLDTINN